MKRARKNKINFIQDQHGNSVATPDDIVDIFIAYFQNLFATQLTHTAMETNTHHQVTIEDDFSTSTPNEQEILRLIKEMKRDSSPRLDGLNVAFYRAAWPWIKDDVKDFHNTGHLHHELNSTCIVLIPKKTNSVVPQDCRPISLCNVIYKIIAKSLA
ncbi:hypothetical protein PR202_gb26301 [Eleusine coracana subsp. coracana]|uniref:Uncharacterized protein n=1 Tax=Eleusine coracana subsp. coracana TaxID=191504 RepID=A0AAV5FNU9_ELECO|nr:hypothetical protein PR202_gb26301 [Eleusine coracana subsp. coracana]